MTLRPNTGYMVGNIEIVDADGYAVGYIYDDATNTVLFTMPTLSGDPVNDPVNARAKNTVVRVSFVPAATYFEDTGNTVRISTGAGGTVTASSYAPTPGTPVTLSISTERGYELSGLYVTASDGTSPTLTRLDDLGTQYSFTMPAGTADVTATFKRGSDWSTVTDAADTIGAAGDKLGTAIDSATAQSQALMDALNELLNSPNPSEPQIQAVLDALNALSNSLTTAGGAVTDVIGAANTIAGTTAPYIAEAAVRLNEHLGYAHAEPAGGLEQHNERRRGRPRGAQLLERPADVQFQGLGSEYSQRVDSLCGNMKNISDALTALNTEVGNSATVLVSDLRKVNDQFSVVMLMLVEAIKAAASPNIGDVFTDVSEEAGSATDGNVAGCGNTGSVYGDVNIGGIAGAMAIEFDFDPESDLTGSSTISRAFNSRCILRECENNGSVKAKDNCAGGVVGLMELGVTQNCENYGAVTSESGDYVGGVAGSSASTIRACWAMCRSRATTG